VGNQNKLWDWKSTTDLLTSHVISGKSKEQRFSLSNLWTVIEMLKQLKCDLCGWTSQRKRFPLKELNEHFEHALQIRCPRNICHEQYDHSVPKGYVVHTWYDYGGWETVEKKPKVVSIDETYHRAHAKWILEEGLRQMEEEKRHPKRK